MEDQEVTTDAGAAQPEGTKDAASDVVPRSEFNNVVAQRQTEKQKRRELTAQLDEYKAREKEAEDAKLREQGEFQKLLEAEQSKSSSLEQKIASMLREQRSTMAVDAVSSQLEGVDRSMVHALMLLQEKQGVDIAPEEVSTDFVDTMVGHIKKAAPQLFQPKGIGGTPGVPGTEDKATGDKARVKRLAQKYSKGR